MLDQGQLRSRDWINSSQEVEPERERPVTLQQWVPAGELRVADFLLGLAHENPIYAARGSTRIFRLVLFIIFCDYFSLLFIVIFHYFSLLFIIIFHYFSLLFFITFHFHYFSSPGRS